jgi:hypothetical protein
MQLIQHKEWRWTAKRSWWGNRNIGKCRTKSRKTEIANKLDELNNMTWHFLKIYVCAIYMKCSHVDQYCELISLFLRCSFLNVVWCLAVMKWSTEFINMNLLTFVFQFIHSPFSFPPFFFFCIIIFHSFLRTLFLSFFVQLKILTLRLQ